MKTILVRSSLFALLLSATSSQAAEAVWHDFHFLVGDYFGRGEERLALLLPATINGVACRVQLDTGANGDILWRAAAPADKAARPVPVSLQVGDIRRTISADPASVAALQLNGCGAGPIASLGNAFFEHGTLQLDLGRQRFAFTPAATLAGDAAALPMFYPRWAEPGGHVLLEVSLGNGARGYALFDTGAARFGLAATNLEEWNALTAGAALRQSASVAEYSLSNAGSARLTCYETPMADGVAVGRKALPPVMASYCVGHGFKAPLKLVGVLGLQPLGRRLVTLDYVSGRWLLGD